MSAARRYGTLVLVLLPSLTAVGCSLFGPGDDPQTGSFELSYGGDVSGSHSGVAIFDHQETSAGTVFVLFGRDFSEARDADTGFQVGRSGPMPRPETYDLTAFDGSLAELEQFGLGMQVDSRGLSAVATSGTITFADVDSDRVQGEFSATLTGHMDGDRDITITASGSFEAVSCEDSVENCGRQP